MSLTLVPSHSAVLYEVARPIRTDEMEDIGTLAGDMVKLAIASDGVGLAAPQVGLSIRLFVMRTDGGWLVCVNPEIVAHGRDTEVLPEGCLSFPGRSVEATRWRVVTLEYTGCTTGKRIKRVLKGLDARVAQHEVAHLSGECLFARPEAPVSVPQPDGA